MDRTPITTSRVNECYCRFFDNYTIAELCCGSRARTFRRRVCKISILGSAKAKTAALWLYLVFASTVLNSLILFKYRFIDLLIGLSFTQYIDAIFVGMQLEPPGAPWWYTAYPALVLDMPFVGLLLVLAVKVSRRRRGATRFSFWRYLIDTLVVTLNFAASIAIFHSPLRPLAWQSLTLIAHGVGLVVLSAHCKAQSLHKLLREWRNQALALIDRAFVRVSVSCGIVVG